MLPFHVLCAASISAATACAAWAQDPPGLPGEPHIVVTGAGSVQAEPDYLELTILVTLRRQDGPSAKADVDEIAAAVLRALYDLGIAHEQLDTSSLTLDISYEHEKDTPVAVSYEASRSIDLTLLEFGKFDEVVARVTEAGATHISSPRLRSRREAELMEQARALAIQDARATASSLARGFGRDLGPVYGIATSDARAWHGARRGGIFGDPSDHRWLFFDPGPIEFRQSVYAVYLLGPKVATVKE